MAQNIEIKAKVSRIENSRNKIEKIIHKKPIEINQEDIFFKTEKGRLKLRQLAENKGELIFYERKNSFGPKLSDYYIFKTSEPESLKHLLDLALGIRGIVRKKRLLYLTGNARIHLDEVENLGAFIELEVVLSDNQDEKEGNKIANDLMAELDINEEDLVDKAYIDLLL